MLKYCRILYQASQVYRGEHTHWLEYHVLLQQFELLRTKEVAETGKCFLVHHIYCPLHNRIDLLEVLPKQDS